MTNRLPINDRERLAPGTHVAIKPGSEFYDSVKARRGVVECWKTLRQHFADCTDPTTGANMAPTGPEAEALLAANGDREYPIVRLAMTTGVTVTGPYAVPPQELEAIGSPVAN